ncbi:MAG: hybrid sensor histidine kinase/response regulator [Anaerolineales bacterium]
MLPKILIIDDELIIRETLSALLSSEEIELIFAENGESGLQLAHDYLPDAILLDVMMPGMDGYETCRQIRAASDLAEIPIIMITALDDRKARLTGLVAGADDFLTKPFDGVELQIRIKNIMRLNRYRNLIAERSRFYWVVENSEKGYLVLDQNQGIQYANQQAQAYFHLPEVYTGLNFDCQVKRYYQQHTPEDGNIYQASYLVQPETANGHAFWLRMEELKSSSEMEDQHLVRVSNVTDEMSTYQDIRKINLLVSHKLRTPVSHIYLSMTLLDKNLDEMAVEDVKPMIKTAWQGAERLVTEVHEILKYINAPIALAEGTPFSMEKMPKMIQNAMEILGLKNVDIFMADIPMDWKLSISKNAMELIIYEILENSEKFHPTRTPHVEIYVEKHCQDSVQIRFLDDGQVMTAEQIVQAKQPYSQGEKWFTGEVSGMGLGIPLIETLIWQVGGQIRIDNREDKDGLCVNLVLPVLK